MPIHKNKQSTRSLSKNQQTEERTNNYPPRQVQTAEAQAFHEPDTLEGLSEQMTATSEGAERTQSTAVSKEKTSNNKHKMKGTKIKKDRAITCKPTTETATEAEAEAADEGQSPKKQEQDDQKHHQPESLERK